MSFMVEKAGACTAISTGLLLAFAGFSQGALSANDASSVLQANPGASGTQRVSSKAGESRSKAEDMSGLVLGMTGNWKISRDGTSQPIKAGDALPDGWVLQAASSDSTITIVLVNGTRLHCPGNPLCGGPIAVNKTPSTADSWWTTAVDMFRKSPVRGNVTPMSRELKRTINIQDAVVKLQDGQIDLSPVVTGLADGSYFLKLEPVAAKAGRSAANPTTFVYHGGTKPLVPLADAQPGLYRMMLVDPDQESVEEVWLLAAEPDRYGGIKSEFDKAVGVAAQCKNEVSDDMLRSFVRACMEALSSGAAQARE